MKFCCEYNCDYWNNSENKCECVREDQQGKGQCDRDIRIIIAGTRTFDDYELLESTVNKIIHQDLVHDYKVSIISGKAPGADSQGEEYAIKHNYRLHEFPANWNKYGKKAGMLRNEEMAKFSIKDNSIGILVAFWDGKSKGTKGMINYARKHGLTVYQVIYNSN